MSQSLLDDQSGAPEDDKEARLHQLEKKVDTLSCELALLRQHMDSGFALVRSDMATCFAESDLRMAERFAEADRRHAANMLSLANQLQAQMAEADKRQEARVVEMSCRQDAFGRWMVGLTLSVVILFAHVASRYF